MKKKPFVTLEKLQEIIDGDLVLDDLKKKGSVIMQKL